MGVAALQGARPMTTKQLRIVYDGDCPFCSNYVRLVQLKEIFQVELIDARTRPHLVEAYADQGYDLNEGILVERGADIYHGSEAVLLLSRLSDGSGLWNRLMATLLGTSQRGKLVYPVLRFGRNATLFVLGRKPI